MPVTRSTAYSEPTPSEEEVVYISRDALESLIREVADSRQRQVDSNERIAHSLEKIASTMAEMSANVVTSSTALSEKLDGVIEALKQNNNTSTPTSLNVEDFLKQRKTLTERIARNESVTAYYNELLGEEKPFVRKEFRMKVHKNASETDIRNRRQQTIDNVKWEIKIMQDRLSEFKDKKLKLDERIEEFIKTHESSRHEISERVQKMETKTREEYERDKLSLMKKTDAEEKRVLTEYLLTFQGEESKTRSGKSKNFKGNSANRRPPWRGHKES